MASKKSPPRTKAVLLISTAIAGLAFLYLLFFQVDSPFRLTASPTINEITSSDKYARRFLPQEYTKEADCITKEECVNLGEACSQVTICGQLNSRSPRPIPSPLPSPIVAIEPSCQGEINIFALSGACSSSGYREFTVVCSSGLKQVVSDGSCYDAPSAYQLGKALCQKTCVEPIYAPPKLDDTRVTQ